MLRLLVIMAIVWLVCAITFPVLEFLGGILWTSVCCG
jgi:hypothetical protein